MHVGSKWDGVLGQGQTREAGLAGSTQAQQP